MAMADFAARVTRVGACVVAALAGLTWSLAALTAQGARPTPKVVDLRPQQTPLRRQGEITGPKCDVSFDEPMANSSWLSLPSMIAPLRQRLPVTVDS